MDEDHLLLADLNSILDSKSKISSLPLCDSTTSETVSEDLESSKTPEPRYKVKPCVVVLNKIEEDVVKIKSSKRKRSVSEDKPLKLLKVCSVVLDKNLILPTRKLSVPQPSTSDATKDEEEICQEQEQDENTDSVCNEVKNSDLHITESCSVDLDSSESSFEENTDSVCDEVKSSEMHVTEPCSIDFNSSESTLEEDSDPVCQEGKRIELPITKPCSVALDSSESTLEEDSDSVCQEGKIIELPITKPCSIVLDSSEVERYFQNISRQKETENSSPVALTPEPQDECLPESDPSASNPSPPCSPEPPVPSTPDKNTTQNVSLDSPGFQNRQSVICHANTVEDKSKTSEPDENDDIIVIKEVSKSDKIDFIDLALENDEDNIPEEPVHTEKHQGQTAASILKNMLSTDSSKTVLCHICGLSLKEGESYIAHQATHANQSKPQLPTMSLMPKNMQQLFSTSGVNNSTIPAFEISTSTIVSPEVLKAKEPVLLPPLLNLPTISHKSSAEKSNYAFKCKKCERVFLSSKSFLLHTIQCQLGAEKHNFPKKFQCKYCNAAFVLQDKYFEHLKIHYKDAVEIVNSSSSIDKPNPIVQAKIPDSIFRCKYCNEVCADQKIFYSHIIDCHSTKCTMCGLLFTTENPHVTKTCGACIQLNKTKLTDKDDSNTTFCSSCKIHFSHTRYYNRHKDIKHEMAPFCIKCLQVFLTNELRHAHMQQCISPFKDALIYVNSSHDVPMYIKKDKLGHLKCDLCDKIYKGLPSLRLHKARAHNHEPYCNFCYSYINFRADHSVCETEHLKKIKKRRLEYAAKSREKKESEEGALGAQFVIADQDSSTSSAPEIIEEVVDGQVNENQQEYQNFIVEEVVASCPYCNSTEYTDQFHLQAHMKACWKNPKWNDEEMLVSEPTTAIENLTVCDVKSELEDETSLHNDYQILIDNTLGNNSSANNIQEFPMQQFQEHPNMVPDSRQNSMFLNSPTMLPSYNTIQNRTYNTLQNGTYNVGGVPNTTPSSSYIPANTSNHYTTANSRQGFNVPMALPNTPIGYQNSFYNYVNGLDRSNVLLYRELLKKCPEYQVDNTRPMAVNLQTQSEVLRGIANEQARLMDKQCEVLRGISNEQNMLMTQPCENNVADFYKQFPMGKPC